MSTIDTFVEVVGNICLRRQMHVAEGTFYEVCAYLGGYAHASPDCPLSGEGWGDFNEFICATFRSPGKYCWPYVIKQCSVNDDEATARLHGLLVEFTEKGKTQSLEEIAGESTHRKSSRCGRRTPRETIDGDSLTTDLRVDERRAIV
jgi:hypothetical protein